ncbi:MAG: hypothetical protein HY320_02805 [Armatimonadetes bacterium]|nr:hypothetical protein [Armatimonadota bacterium]
MKRIRHHRASRWVARLLVLAMTLSTFAGIGIRRAEAQAGPADIVSALATPRVYMLDFNNNTPLGGTLLGRTASAQVALALLDSGNWEVVSDDQVHGRIQALGIRPPFDRVARSQIAAGLSAIGVVYGTIEEARVTANPAQAFVRLRVVVEDVRNGVLMNGAVGLGQSQPRVGFTGDADVLLEEALARAAFRAREQMDRFRLPTGTILNTSVVGENEQVAFMNVGIRQGVRRGMEFIVLRLGELVGRVRATSVDADTTSGRIVENYRGVRPEDRVRAIFSFRDFPPPREESRRGSNVLPPEKVRLSARGRQIEALVASEEDPGEAVLAANSQSGQPGGSPPVVVEEPASGGGGGGGIGKSALKLLVGGALLVGLLALGGGSKGGTTAFGTEAQAVQLAPGSPTGIRVTWKRPRQVLSEQVLQYVIWRSNPGGLGAVQVVGAVNGDGLHRFDDTETTVHTVVGAFNGTPGTAFRPPDFTNLAGDREDVEDVPGLIAGQKYRYQVATAWHFEQDLNGDGTPDPEDLMGPLSSASPLATFLPAPEITSPTNTVPPTDVDLADLTVDFTTVAGGNEYALAVSREVDFNSASTIIAATKNVLPPDLGGPDEEAFTSVDALRGKLRTDEFIFLAVGVRSRDDRLAPGPNGFVFSAPVQVRNSLFGPPPPPRGAGRSGRGGRKN